MNTNDFPIEECFLILFILTFIIGIKYNQWFAIVTSLILIMIDMKLIFFKWSVNKQ